MNQQKYLLKAFLILIVIGGVYIVAEKLFSLNTVPPTASISRENKGIDYQKQDSSIIKGARLFRPCKACHTIFKDATGPALAGVSDRWPDKKELFAFIRNPMKVMVRNSYARKLKEKFGSMTPAFPDLSDKQIQAILSYIKMEENKKSKPIPIKKVSLNKA